MAGDEVRLRDQIAGADRVGSEAEVETVIAPDFFES